uniref:Uncharacterized protein n=1 Tax=Alexandrium monilatum TaxID=311494 RepID=A0A7S4T415_9DINO
MAPDHADAAGGVVGLQARLAAKTEEAEALRVQIEQAKLDAQQLRLRLQAAGVADPSFVPAKLRAGNNGLDSQNMEFRSMLQWLVEGVDLDRHVVFECGTSDGEILVGGRRVQLQRMATWPISAGSHAAGLKLSVPVEMQAEIAEVLLAARARGRVEEHEVQRLAGSWEMVGAEVASAQVGHPEPAVFLVRRGASQAMIVGHWPAVEFAPKGGPASAPFDPAQHFSRLAQTEDASGPSEETSAGRPSICTGDRVEVEYQGEWFSGLLQGVDTNLANIQCDVDSPGVITVAPLTSVRPAKPAAAAESKKLPRHMRARSMG